jgi:hypothetical protein
VKPPWYRALWILEIGALMVLILGSFMVPGQDFARTEFDNWHRHPSAETLKALQEKHQRNSRFLVEVLAPPAALAVLLAVPLFLFRTKRSKPN